ncbi:unnamed protein product [Oikopleura dioica]|uniref:Uncharacterized protein n=1 Tax=Oikopleura dioica TaxID=34765 RepID=E4XB34_OIKDI|nr:unnamed protein product [Oikopleura dioica]
MAWNHLMTRAQPDSRQDWAKMTDRAAEGSNYADVYRVPPMNDRTKSFKPPPKAFSSGAKFAAVTNYSGDFTGKSRQWFYFFENIKTTCYI